MSEFNWYLNRQGPRGPQGPQGPQGFSPVITVEEDSLNAYILRISTQGSEFLTPNLRGSIEDLGGTYVRYNRETGQLYAGSADNATTTEYGMVRFATDEEIADGEHGVAVDANNLQEVVEPLQNSVNSLSARVTTNEGEIDTINNNITDTNNSINNLNTDVSNIKSNYVTTNTYQTINNTKNFNYNVIVRGQLITDHIYDLRKGTPLIDTVREGNGTYTLMIGGSYNRIRLLPEVYVDTSTGRHKVISEGDIATSSNVGIVKPDGTSITIDADGTIHSEGAYTLPIASSTTLGGVKIGENLSISEDGTLSATGGGGSLPGNVAYTDKVNNFTDHNNFTSIKADAVNTDKIIDSDNNIILRSSWQNSTVYVGGDYRSNLTLQSINVPTWRGYKIFTQRNLILPPTTSEDTQEVHQGADGKLYTKAGGGMDHDALVTWLTENKEQVLQILGLDPIDGGDSTTV